MGVVQCSRCHGSGKNWADRDNKYAGTMICRVYAGVGSVDVPSGAVKCGHCGGGGLVRINERNKYYGFKDCPICQGSGWAVPRSPISG